MLELLTFVGVSEPDFSSCPDQGFFISLERWSLEAFSVAKNGGIVFLRCVHVLELMDWLIELNKCVIKNGIMLHLM